MFEIEREAISLCVDGVCVVVVMMQCRAMHDSSRTCLYGVCLSSALHICYLRSTNTKASKQIKIKEEILEIKDHFKIKHKMRQSSTISSYAILTTLRASFANKRTTLLYNTTTYDE